MFGMNYSARKNNFNSHRKIIMKYVLLSIFLILPIRISYSQEMPALTIKTPPYEVQQNTVIEIKKMPPLLFQGGWVYATQQQFLHY